MNFEKTIAASLLLIFPLGFVGIWRLQKDIDVQRQALHQEQDELVLRSAKLMKVMSLEFAPLVADIYWTRAVQYYGAKHFGAETNLELLWPLLDITSTLDPNLLVAYRFGAMFLSDAPPRGAGRPDLAVELIERGIRANPEYWRLYEDLGFVYYFDMKDYQKASQAFYEGSKEPYAQIWMKVMAAKIAAEGESLSTSIFLWKNVYDTTQDLDVKQNALTHLQLLQAQQDCKQIDAKTSEYEKRYGRRPTRITQLVEADLLRGVPRDPLGFEYVLSDDGKAELNLESPLLERQVMSQPKN